MTSRNRSGNSARRTFLKEVLGIGAALAGVVPAGANVWPRVQGKPKIRMRWQAHPIAKIPHGYQVAVADVDGDGRPDILALSSVENIVEWYENPSWIAHGITTATQRNISVAPLFRQGYPTRGVALATDFGLEDSRIGGNVWWVQPSTALESEWSLVWVGQIPTSHRLRWADLDGDGKQELIDAPLVGSGAQPPDYKIGAPLTWFEAPEVLLRGHVSAGNQGQNVWAPHLIDDSLTVVHGIHVLDWNGDHRDELLTASFEGIHLFHCTGHGKNLQWSKTQLAPGNQTVKSRRGSSEIGVGKVGGRRFLATIEPWHGEQVVIYFEGERGAFWNRQVLDESLRDGHALACGDLNGDGDDEIVAGFRGPGTSLFVYYASDRSGEAWERQILARDMAASGVVIADLNGDGRLDVVAVGASTNNVVWYENLG